MPTVFMPPSHLLDSVRGRDWPYCPDLGHPARAATPPAAADVVIVGAGPAGLAVAGALWQLGIRDGVLLDRTGTPARRFFDRIDAFIQRVLRSPYVPHPCVEGYHDCELLYFARLHWAHLSAVERREIRM